MRVVQPDSTETAANDRRLAAAMLNMESGAIAFDDRMAPLPKPHPPFPTVRVAPITEEGLPVLVHHRPSVGIVFYTASVGFKVRELVERVRLLLAGATEHLTRAYHAAAATPSVVLRHRGRTTARTRPTTTSMPEKPRVAAHRMRDYPARLFVVPTGTALPPHVSYEAAFTWVFLSADIALNIRCFGEREANAMIASILYDEARATTLASGKDVFRLTMADFGGVPIPEYLTAPLPKKDFPEEVLGTLPAGLLQWLRTLRGLGYSSTPPAELLDGLGAEVPEARRVPRPMGALGSPYLPLLDAGLGAPRGALLVHPASGTLSYVGNCSTLLMSSERSTVRLPAAPWRPREVAVAGEQRYQCCLCSAPLGGTAVLLKDPRAPKRSTAELHGVWADAVNAPGASMLPAGQAKSLLLCVHCWSVLRINNCLSGDHVQAEVCRVEIPWSQSETCRKCPGYQRLAVLLAGRGVRPVEGVSGAFTVRVRVDRKEATLLLTGQTLGPFPTVTVPALKALGLVTIPELRIALAPGKWVAADAP